MCNTEDETLVPSGIEESEGPFVESFASPQDELKRNTASLICASIFLLVSGVFRPLSKLIDLGPNRVPHGNLFVFMSKRFDDSFNRYCRLITEFSRRVVKGISATAAECELECKMLDLCLAFEFKIACPCFTE